MPVRFLYSTDVSPSFSPPFPFVIKVGSRTILLPALYIHPPFMRLFFYTLTALNNRYFESILYQ